MKHLFFYLSQNQSRLRIFVRSFLGKHLFYICFLFMQLIFLLFCYLIIDSFSVICARYFNYPNMRPCASRAYHRPSMNLSACTENGGIENDFVDCELCYGHILWSLMSTYFFRSCSGYWETGDTKKNIIAYMGNFHKIFYLCFSV